MIKEGDFVRITDDEFPQLIGKVGMEWLEAMIERYHPDTRSNYER